MLLVFSSVVHRDRCPQCFLSLGAGCCSTLTRSSMSWERGCSMEACGRISHISCLRCLLGIWTLFPRAPCSGSHLLLCVATVHGSFWTNFVYFLREKWTPSSPCSSHPGNLNIISTRSISQSPRASVYVAFGRISHIFIVTVDSDFPAQFALENLDIISTCSHMAVGGVFGCFDAFFALLRVVPELSAPHANQHRTLLT